MPLHCRDLLINLVWGVVHSASLWFHLRECHFFKTQVLPKIYSVRVFFCCRNFHQEHLGRVCMQYEVLAVERMTLSEKD